MSRNTPANESCESPSAETPPPLPDLPLTVETGASFYRTPMHFALTLERAARRIRHRHGRGRERAALMLAGAALIVSMVMQQTGVWDLTLQFGGASIDPHLPSLALLLAWMMSYHVRIGRLRRTILPNRRCFNCGEPLGEEPVNGYGVGACPRCGMKYNIGWYEPPRIAPRV